jgi:hypothetical protein
MGYNRVYLEGNVHDAYAMKKQGTPQKKLVLDRGKAPKGQKRILQEPLPTPPVTTDLSPNLRKLANRWVGASLPCRDSIDALVIRDIKNGTGRHPFADMDTDESPQVPNLPMVSHVYVAPEDPFPVWWKLAQGRSPADRIDPKADANGDGYTNIEAYIFGLPLARSKSGQTAPTPEAQALGRPWPLTMNKTDLNALWTNADAGETICTASNGWSILVGSVATEGGASGCRALLQHNGDFWNPGTKPTDTPEAKGVYTKRGAAVVIAFPVPQRLTGFQVGKLDFNSYTGDHDPAAAVIQGLVGWPSDWTDLTDTVPVSALTEDSPKALLAIPKENRNHYAAYRIIFTKTHGKKPLRLQALSPRRADNANTSSGLE